MNKHQATAVATAEDKSGCASVNGSVATCKYWIVIDEENAPPRAMFRQQYEAENFRELNGGRVETFTMKVRY